VKVKIRSKFVVDVQIVCRVVMYLYRDLAGEICRSIVVVKTLMVCSFACRKTNREVRAAGR
jgi:hypothetical protein